jgi:hypothetical protein
MKAALIFTGSGPVLVLNPFESFQSPEFLQRLAASGVGRFIAREVSLELVQERLSTRFSAVIDGLSRGGDLRVMDVDGHRVLSSLSSKDLGPPIYFQTSRKSTGVDTVEESSETERLWATIDEYGNLVEASYLPMVGSRIVPAIPIQAGATSKQVHFKIDRQGTIFDGSPQSLNGHKLVLYGKSSPALGRADSVIPACTWRSDDKGGWTCT